MYTIITDSEASNYMRPLTATSEGTDDDNILLITSSHLIIEQSLLSLPNIIDKYERETKTLDAEERWRQRKNVSIHYWNV